MEILIISGLSGGGKSRAASFLEDIGYYTVDNLPAEMMMKFAGVLRRFAAAGTTGWRWYTTCAPASPRTMLIDVLEQLKAMAVSTAACCFWRRLPPETIINRYKETRRTHPLQAQGV